MKDSSPDDLYEARDAKFTEKFREKILNDRLEASKITTALNEVREGALAIMLLFLEMRIERRLALCVEAWESIFAAISRNGKTSSLVDSRQLRSPMSSASFSSPSDVPPQSPHNFAGKEDLDNIFLVFNPIFQKLNHQSFQESIICPDGIGCDTYLPGNFKDNTVQVMLELFTFHNQDLTKSAMSMIIRNMSQRNALAMRLNDVQLLVFPQAARVFHETQFVIRRLGYLQKMIAADDAAGYKEASSLINRLTYEVSVRVDNRPEIVAKNQSILFNLGIDLPIRRMLGLYLHRDTSRRDRGEIEADLPINEMRRDLFQDCYTLLRALVKDNRKHKQHCSRTSANFLSIWA